MQTTVCGGFLALFELRDLSNKRSYDPNSSFLLKIATAGSLALSIFLMACGGGSDTLTNNTESSGSNYNDPLNPSLPTLATLAS